MLDNFYAFVVCWLFSKLTFSKNSFRNNIRVWDCWVPDQDQHPSVLIWVQTACIDYQQTTKEATSSKIDLSLLIFFHALVFFVFIEMYVLQHNLGKSQLYCLQFTEKGIDSCLDCFKKRFTKLSYANCQCFSVRIRNLLWTWEVQICFKVYMFGCDSILLSKWPELYWVLPILKAVWLKFWPFKHQSQQMLSFCRLLKCFRSISNKQCRPRLDCSYALCSCRSSLI